uniref:Uncharacterized protein n=1 Tax=Solanum tuberosum TaxID=4113 RepID=M1DB72_SOLTU
MASRSSSSHTSIARVLEKEFKKRKQEKGGKIQGVHQVFLQIEDYFTKGLIPKRVRNRERNSSGFSGQGLACRPTNAQAEMLRRTGAGALRHSVCQGHLPPPVLRRLARLSSFKGYLYSPLILTTLSYF